MTTFSSRVESIKDSYSTTNKTQRDLKSNLGNKMTNKLPLADSSQFQHLFTPITSSDNLIEACLNNCNKIKEIFDILYKDNRVAGWLDLFNVEYLLKANLEQAIANQAKAKELEESLNKLKNLSNSEPKK